MTPTEELRVATSASSQGASWNFGWPADASGAFTLAPVADESAPFLVPPADDAAALRRAAYWTAIAARALGDRTLAATSGAYVARATAAMASFSTDQRANILREAAQAIRSEIPTTAAPDVATAQKRSIAILTAGYLDSQAQPTQLQAGTEGDTGFLATLRKQYDEVMAQIKGFLRKAAIGAGIVSAAIVAGLVWWMVSRRKKGE
jgi:hypothetical protein